MNDYFMNLDVASNQSIRSDCSQKRNKLFFPNDDSEPERFSSLSNDPGHKKVVSLFAECETPFPSPSLVSVPQKKDSNSPKQNLSPPPNTPQISISNSNSNAIQNFSHLGRIVPISSRKSSLKSSSMMATKNFFDKKSVKVGKGEERKQQSSILSPASSKGKYSFTDVIHEAAGTHSQKNKFLSQFVKRVEDVQKAKKKGRCGKIGEYLKSSSLFIFHKDFYVRKKIGEIVILPNERVVEGEEEEDVEVIGKGEQKKVSEESGDKKSSFLELHQSRRDSIMQEVKPLRKDSMHRDSFREGCQMRLREEKTVPQPHRTDLLVAEYPGKCSWVCSNKAKFFDNLVLGIYLFIQFILSLLVMIILSSILLVFDSNLMDPDSAEKILLKNLDMFFVFIFLIEALMKIIALGFIWAPLTGTPAYLRVGWNILDFSVLLGALIDVHFDMQNSPFKALKALRVLRALRPLRMVSRNESLKIVVDSLFRSIPAVGNVCLVSILILSVFAIWGINVFKGTFYTCGIEDLSLLQNIKTKTVD